MPQIPQLQVPEYNPQAPSAYDFAPLAQLGEMMKQRRAQEQYQQMSLANLAQGTPSSIPAQPAVPYTSPGRSGYGGGTAAGGTLGTTGSNVQSWYDFARKPLDQGGLGLTHEQAAGKIANLQAESGQNIPAWGPTGDAGTAHGAAQWRGDRLAGLQKYAASKGLDYRSTQAQQGFMREEYLGPEYSAYQKLIATKTPSAAATAINRYYERSADTTGGRESNAERLARLLRGQ